VNESGVLKSEGMWLNALMILQLKRVITYTFWTVPTNKSSGGYDVMKEKADPEEKSNLIPKPINPRAALNNQSQLSIGQSSGRFNMSSNLS